MEDVQEQDGGLGTPGDGTTEDGALSTGESAQYTPEVLRATLQQLDRQLRSTQGDATRTRTELGQQIAELRGLLTGALRSGQQGNERQASIEDYASAQGLDPTDPAHIAIARKLYSHDQELETVHRERQTMQQRAAWDATERALAIAADIGDLDYKTDIAPHIDKGDPNVAYWQGLELIQRAAKGKKAGNAGKKADDTTPDVQQRVNELLAKAGIAEPGTRLGRQQSGSFTREQIEDMSPADYAKNRTRIYQQMGERSP